MKDSLKLKQIWAALISIDGFGPKTFFQLKDQLKKNQIGWHEFWVKPWLVLPKTSRSEKILLSIKKFKREQGLSRYWHQLKLDQVSVVCWDDPAFPPLLKEIDSPPPVLFYRGDFSLCQQRPVAVVGTRQMTSYGRMVAEKIGRELAYHQATVVSGFMYGIDVTAQQAALAGGGQTVGILAFGFDHMLPTRHKPIFDQFLEQGACFITEYAPHVPPNKGTFRQRNRLVAGLSLGVVVVEAAVKSGTQLTVDYALDYGRDVFAIPGSINNPYSEGTRMMLNKGAQLVVSGQEVVDGLTLKKWFGRASPSKKINQTELGLKPIPAKIFQAIQLDQLTTDQLASCLDLKLSFSGLLAELTSLEIQGLIRKEAGKWTALW
ncbi:MAG: DNA-protecting protein DprA [Candidatus Pacebacteria bacterium]|nr:DNA-protecting protein DprA [Candidatus Paceibacterota bacterium]